MSIRIKLTLMFLAVAVIPLFFVSALTFHNYRDSLESSRLSQLRDLADIKAERIETYFNQLKSYAQIIQNIYTIKKYLPVLQQYSAEPSNPDYLAAREIVGQILRKTQAAINVSDIMLVNPSGKVIYASKPGNESKDMSSGLEAEQKAFLGGKDKICFSGVYFDEREDKRYEMLVTAPAFDLNDASIGLIAFEVDMTAIYSLVQDNTGLGNTGETLIGKKTGNQATFLNPLRHDPKAALNRKITFGEKEGFAIQEAVQGRENAGEQLDYRGVKVIAAWRYLPLAGWGMVAKIDAEEAFAEAANLRNMLLIILGIIVVLSGIMAFSIAQSISEPIKKLSDSAAIIGGGNLDYKIETHLKDEIGQLSRSFDKMTLDLKRTTASRDELNREIDERKQVEESLRESEQRMQMALQVSRSFAFEWEPATDRVLRSDNCGAILGVSGDETRHDTGQRYFQRVHPEDRDRFVRMLGGLKPTADTYHTEYRVLRPDGTATMEEYARGFFDGEGKLCRLIGVTIDITERKQAEQALRDANDRLILAQQAAEAGIWDWDMTTNRLEWSADLITLFGLEPTKIEASFDVWQSVLHPEDRRVAQERIEASIQNHTPLDSEYRIVLPDGQVRWINALGNTIYDENGQARRMMGICINISDRKRAEQEIRRNAQRFEILSETASELLQSKNPQARINSLCSRVMEHLDCHIFVNYLVDEHAHRLHLNASGGLPEKMAENIEWLDFGQAICGAVAQQGRRIVAENIMESCDPRADLVRSVGIRSYACHPILSQGTVIGTLSFGTRSRGNFSDDDLATMKTMTDQVAAAMERKKAEEAIQVSETRYRRLFEAARDGILILDADSGQIVDVNPFIKDMLGYSHEYFLNKKIWEIGLLKNIAASKESFLELQTKGFVRYENMPLETKDGRHISVEFVSNVYLVDHKKIIQCNIRDITDRVLAEAELKKSYDELELRVRERTAELARTVDALQNEIVQRIATEQIAKTERKRFEDVLEMMPAYAVLLTMDYRVAYANRTFREWFGDDNGRKCHEFLFNCPEPCENCQTYNVLKTGKSQFWEWTGPNGRNYDIYDYPFTDTDGSPLIMEIGLDVTAHKQAQLAVQQGEERYRSLTEATTQVVWTTDAQGQVVGDMPSWREFTGQSVEEIQGWGWIHSLHPDDRECTSNIWKHSVHNKTFYVTEYRIRRRDGEYRYVSVHGVPVLEQDGSIREWIGTCTDITEQKQSQEAIRSASIYARSLLEASLDPLVTISADGKITDVNEATISVTGTPREQLIGTDFSDYFTEPNKAREGYQEVFARGFVTDYPLTIRRRDGRLTDVLYNATVYKDTHGNILGVFAAARDVTGRKAAEKKQNVTNSLLKLFAKKSSRKEYLDSTVKIIRNWSRCEFVGVRIKDNENNIPYEAHVDFDPEFIAKENSLHLDRDRCVCIRAIQQQPGPGERNYVTAGGSFHCNDAKAFLTGLTDEQKKEYRGNCIQWGFQSIAVVPIRYRDEILGAVHIADFNKDMADLAKVQFIEITIAPLIGEAVHRFNAEAELEKYRLHLEDLVKHRTEDLEKANAQLQFLIAQREKITDDLARSNYDLEQFAYVASHDLQEPLRAVAGFTDLLKRRWQDQLDEKSAEYMHFVVDGVSRMQSLIHGLLEYSRISSRGKNPAPAQADQSLNLAIQNLQVSIRETSAVITSDPLPTVCVDGTQLTQLFQNLIGNAIKFRGQRRPEIHVKADYQEDGWQFAVRDNGIGIDPQFADRIFLIFQRLHTREKYPGTGIGLSICKKIVERHGGKIWVESLPGQGSTFYFTLPDGES